MKINGPILLLILLCCCQSSNSLQKHSPIIWGFALDGYPIDESKLLEVRERTSLSPQLVSFYLQWPKPGEKENIPISSFEAIWEMGAIPCLTWEPMYFIDKEPHTLSLQEILSKQYEPYLHNMAEAIKGWGKPVIIRFGHEMNLNQYHWGTRAEQYGKESPQIYVKMFRYLVNFFRQDGAANALWAFCPNADSVPGESWNRASRYYPGDEFVDILGMDGYDWQDASKVKTRSFEELFRLLYRDLKEIAPQKPIFVFETATSGSPKAKTLWIKQALEMGAKWQLKGIVWFQVDKEKNWALDKENSEAISLIREASSFSQQWAQNYTINNRH